MNYERNCPKCGKIITYKRKRGYNLAIRKNSICNKCVGEANKKRNQEVRNLHKDDVFERNCPNCNKTLKYTNIKNRNKANKNKTLCCVCAGNKRHPEINTILERNCPKCNNVLTYKSKKTYNVAVKNQSCCFNCGVNKSQKGEVFKRNCPNCKVDLFYSTKWILKKAEKNNRLCKNCLNENKNSKKIIWKRNCPKCNREIIYKEKSGYKKTLNKNSICKNCVKKYQIKNNSIVKSHPEIIKEWNYEKNLKNPACYSKGSCEKVWWKCEKGHEWESRIRDRVKNKTFCPYCFGIYKGENTISSYLQRKNIYFILHKYQKINNRNFFFDFYIEGYGMIEYHGQQHYQIVNFAGIEKRDLQKKLEVTWERDEIKRNWCYENNIELLEIGYYYFDYIEDILDNWFGEGELNA